MGEKCLECHLRKYDLNLVQHAQAGETGSTILYAEVSRVYFAHFDYRDSYHGIIVSSTQGETLKVM